MADYMPPPGPPPPKVPEGWKAQWNEQFKEWFYINLYTKKSRWEKPTEPAYPPSGNNSPPPGVPPGYSDGSPHTFGDTKSNNPFDASWAGASAGAGSLASPNTIDDDAKLAAKLQAEEDERAQSQSRGNSMSEYANTPLPPQSYNTELPPRAQKGFLSKLLGKSHSQPHQPAYGGGYGSPPPQDYGGYPQQYPPPVGYGRYPPPQGYSGYPPQGYSGYPPQGYGGYPPQGYGGYAEPYKKTGGGMGAMGGAALGLGGGLVGGMLLEDAIQDHDHSVYEQGYDQGQMNADGGDFGGGGDIGDF